MFLQRISEVMPKYADTSEFECFLKQTQHKRLITVERRREKKIKKHTQRQRDYFVWTFVRHHWLCRSVLPLTFKSISKLNPKNTINVSAEYTQYEWCKISGSQCQQPWCKPMDVPSIFVSSAAFSLVLACKMSFLLQVKQEQQKKHMLCLWTPENQETHRTLVRLLAQSLPSAIIGK